MGWQHLENGALLAAAEGQFDVLITMDKSVPSQQSLARFSIALLILRARSNRLADLLLMLPQIRAALSRARKGSATVIS